MLKPMLSIISAVVIFLLLTGISLAAGSYTWPITGNVLTLFKSSGHRGIDIAAETGDSIVSAQDGTVVWIGKTPRGESCVSIDHSGGISSTYLPVSATVSKGQVVKAGEAIGTLSAEGDPSSSESHLHFGLYETVTRDNKVYLSPEEYLPVMLLSQIKATVSETGEAAVNTITDQSIAETPIAESSGNTGVGSLAVGASEAQPGEVGSSLRVANGLHAPMEEGSVRVSSQASGIISAAGSAADVSERVPQLRGAQALDANSSSANNAVRDSTYHGPESNTAKTGNNESALNSSLIGGDEASARIITAIGGAMGSPWDLPGVAVGETVAKKSSATNSSLTTAHGYRKKLSIGETDGVQQTSKTIRTTFSAPSSNDWKTVSSANPFIVRRTEGVEAGSRSAVSENRLADNAPASSKQGNATQTLLSSVMDWKELPDVISALAILGIAAMSISRFMRGTRTIQEILPKHAIASC